MLDRSSKVKFKGGFRGRLLAQSSHARWVGMSASVTLALNGEPTLNELADAASALRELLIVLNSQVAQRVKVEWTVDALEISSAVLSFRGTETDSQAAEAVAAAYLSVGRDLASGRRIADFDPMVARPVQSMVEIINGHVPSIRFETLDDDVTFGRLNAVEPDARPSDIPGAYGAVLGRVQTLSSRGSLRFTLYDLLHNKAVSCYLREDQQDIMRNAWDRVALVRGWIKRDSETGRPTSVRRVRSIELRAEGVPGEWRDAIGVLPSSDENWESVVRRVRDAQ